MLLTIHRKVPNSRQTPLCHPDNGNLRISPNKLPPRGQNLFKHALYMFLPLSFPRILFRCDIVMGGSTAEPHGRASQVARVTARVEAQCQINWPMLAVTSAISVFLFWASGLLASYSSTAFANDTAEPVLMLSVPTE